MIPQILIPLAMDQSTWPVVVSFHLVYLAQVVSGGEGLASFKHVQTTAVFSVATGPSLIALRSSPGWYCFEFCPTR